MDTNMNNHLKATYNNQKTLASRKNFFSIFFLFIAMLLAHPAALAQLFTEIPRSGTPMANVKAVWIASGNKLHPIAAGQPSGNGALVRTILHQQKSKGVFIATQAGLPDIAFGGLDVGDVNNDRIEDLVITGITSSNKHQSGIYLQQKNGSFIKSSAQIPALADGSVQFGDYDKDGDLDLLICGRTADGSLHTRVLRNDGQTFADINANLPGIHYGKAIWVDASNTGKLDIMLTGKAKDGIITKLFPQRNGQFASSKAHFTPVYHSDVVAADFNGDGKIDLMIAGQTKSGNPSTKYYLGNGNYQFDDGSNSGIRQLMNASLDAGDYNGDGFPDVVITGESLERPYTIVLQNLRGKGFKDIMAGLPGVSNGTARWGDFDNDGDLDLYIAGVDVCFNLIGSVYRCTLNPRIDIESPEEYIPMEVAAGPKYYFVFSSCYCDPENTGTKSYHGFVSNIHKEKQDFDLNYMFNHLLISNYPGWNKADRGHRTSNAFVSVKDAEEGRKTVIASYLQDNYTVHYLNW